MKTSPSAPRVRSGAPGDAGGHPCRGFRRVRAATRGLMAAPWTPASHLLCCREERREPLTAEKSPTTLDFPTAS